MTRANPSKIRLRYSKYGKIRFTSHRDMARVWERVLRKMRLPVAYSEGFNPRPRLSFGLALPTGFESAGEYLDIDISPEITIAATTAEALRLRAELASGGGEESENSTVLDLELAMAQIDHESPQGITVQGLAQIDRKELSLQQAVTSCTWEFALGIDETTLRRAVESALAADSLPLERERKGKTMTDDIRPQILDLLVVDADQNTPRSNGSNASSEFLPTVDGPLLIAELGTQPRALRPAEFLQAIELPAATSARVQRTHQWITQQDSGEAAREPLEAVSPPSVPTEVSAV